MTNENELIKIVVSNPYLALIKQFPALEEQLHHASPEHPYIRKLRFNSGETLIKGIQRRKKIFITRLFSPKVDQATADFLQLIAENDAESYKRIKRLFLYKLYPATEELIEAGLIALNSFQTKTIIDRRYWKKILNRFFQTHQLPLSILYRDQKYQVSHESKPVTYEKFKKRQQKKIIRRLSHLLAIPGGLISGSLFSGYIAYVYLPLFFTSPVVLALTIIVSLLAFAVFFKLVQTDSNQAIKNLYFHGIKTLFMEMTRAQKITMAILMGLTITAGAFFFLDCYGTAIAFFSLMGLPLLANPLGLALFATLCALATIIFVTNSLSDISQAIRKISLEKIKQNFYHIFLEPDWKAMTHRERLATALPIVGKFLVYLAALALAALICAPALLSGQTNYFVAVNHISKTIAIFTEASAIIVLGKILTSFTLISNFLANHNVLFNLTATLNHMKKNIKEMIYGKPKEPPVVAKIVHEEIKIQTQRHEPRKIIAKQLVFFQSKQISTDEHLFQNQLNFVKPF